MIQLKPLKIEKNTFFVSDLHFGHDKEFLWGKRGYKNVQEHNDGVLKYWNSKISSVDSVFHLGDLLFGYNGEERVIALLEKLNFGTLYLMGGNHLAGFKSLKMDGFELGTKKIIPIPNYFEVSYEGRLIVLSHYPIASWNRMDKGSWMIHGHCHGEYTGNGKIMDVVIECGGPFSVREIQTKMSKL